MASARGVIWNRIGRGAALGIQASGPSALRPDVGSGKPGASSDGGRAFCAATFADGIPWIGIGFGFGRGGRGLGGADAALVVLLRGNPEQCSHYEDCECDGDLLHGHWLARRASTIWIAFSPVCLVRNWSLMLQCFGLSEKSHAHSIMGKW